MLKNQGSGQAGSNPNFRVISEQAVTRSERDIQRAPSRSGFDAVFDQGRTHGKRSEKSTTPGVTEKISRCHPGLAVVANPNANCFSVRRHTSARAATITGIHLKLVIESVSFIETAVKRHCTSRAIEIKASPSFVRWACCELLGRVVSKWCCCGATHKDRPSVPVEWLKNEWRKRGLLKQFQLSVSGCVGPCDVPNVVVVNSESGSQWLGNLDDFNQYRSLVEWQRAPWKSDICWSCRENSKNTGCSPGDESVRGRIHVVEVINFDKGSKRKMRQIRWRPFEIMSLVLLLLVTLTISVMAGLWEISHGSDEPPIPHLQDRH